MEKSKHLFKYICITLLSFHKRNKRYFCVFASAHANFGHVAKLLGLQ